MGREKLWAVVVKHSKFFLLNAKYVLDRRATGNVQGALLEILLFGTPCLRMLVWLSPLCPPFRGRGRFLFENLYLNYSFSTVELLFFILACVHIMEQCNIVAWLFLWMALILISTFQHKLQSTINFGLSVCLHALERISLWDRGGVRMEWRWLLLGRLVSVEPHLRL